MRYGDGQSVRQMEIGVELGNIITVLPEDAGASSKMLYFLLATLLVLLLILVTDSQPSY